MAKILGSVKRQEVHPDLQAERDKANFNTDELQTYLVGGPQMRRVKEELEELFYKDPILKNSFDWYGMSREDMIATQYKKIRRMAEIDKERFFTNFKLRTDFFHPFLLQGLLPIGIHQSMFILCLEMLTTPEQRTRWLHEAKSLRVVGCYIQTEIGHGSNVSKLETTATYDENTDEFVIHCPSVTAYKMWPGDSGLTSNVSIVYAQLISKGKNYGVQPFYVQLRDRNTHENMPGVISGDLGPKVGFDSKENGWVAFNNVRIPRTNMLMRFAEVDRQGNFRVIGEQKLLYAVMMAIRVFIVRQGGYDMANALTIALRYASVRRQFATLADSAKKERRIIDYQAHHFKLMPPLATAFTQTFAANYIQRQEQMLLQDIEKKDYSRLPVLHHLTSNFKALFSWEALEQIEIIRQSTGGAGFLRSSGFHSIWAINIANPTHEGENTVMALQGVRMVLKETAKIFKGQEPHPLFAYLKEIPALQSKKSQATNWKDFLRIEVVEDALATRAALHAAGTALALQKSKAEQLVKENELFALQMVATAKSHGNYFAFKLFKDEINANNFSDGVKTQLENLLVLFGLDQLNRNSHMLFETGYFSAGDAQKVLQALKAKIATVREQAIPLVESFGVHDGYLMSTIGNKYGDIYETQLEVAKNSALNKRPLPKGFDVYHKFLSAKL